MKKKKKTIMNTKERMEAGYCTITEVCEILGLPRETFYYHVFTGRVAGPTFIQKGTRRPLYTPEEVKQLCTTYAGYTKSEHKKDWSAAFVNECKALLKKGKKNG